MRVHSQRPARKMTPSNAAKTGVLVRNTSATINGASTRAVSTRCFSMGTDPRSGGLGDLRAGAAEAPLAVGVVVQCTRQFRLVHVGPKSVGEIKFRVGDLPEQEIADAMFAAGADEKINGREVGEAEERREGGFVHRIHRQFASLDRQRRLARGLRDIPAAAVVDADVQYQSLV